MKLIKKLLPLVTVGVTVSTAAPLMTSCGETVFTIKFDAGEGVTVKDQRIIKGEPIKEPVVEKQGSYCIGWLCDGEFWNFDTDIPTKNMTLKAYWVADWEDTSTNLLSQDEEGFSQHAEIQVAAGNDGITRAAEMYFKEGEEQGQTVKTPKERVKNDILVQLGVLAKEGAIIEFLAPGSIPGLEFVGRIKSAYSDITIDEVSYLEDYTPVGKPHNRAKITGTLSLNLTAELIDETTKKEVGVYMLHTRHYLENVPYEIDDFNIGDHAWNVRTTLQLLNSSGYNDWEIDRSYLGCAIYNNGQTFFDNDIKSWTINSQEKIAESNIKPITWVSTYMDTVAHGN